MPTTTNMTLTGGLTLGTALTAANGGTGITSLGTGVATALGIATNNASGGLAVITSSSFTPVLNFGGATTGITYTSQLGFYSRTGSVVTFNIYIILSSKGSATGNATITGFPVNFANNGANQIFCFVGNNLTYSGTQLFASSTPNSGTITLATMTSVSGQAALTDAAFANNSGIFITGTYLI